MAYIGSSPTKVVSRQSANIFTYTATANQTAFTGADTDGNTLACTPSDIMVHMNGLRLEQSDYTATTTTVTLGSGAAAGDEVTITAFLTFERDAAVTNVADNVVDEANLKVSNTPTNGYFLSAQSGNTGGLTWATPPAGYANSDVDTHLNQSSASSGQYLQWNGSDYAWAAVSSVGGATGVDFNDNVKARFGTGNDLEIYHDSSGGGENYIYSPVEDIRYSTASSSGSHRFYCYGSQKLQVDRYGIDVTGNMYATGRGSFGSSSSAGYYLYVNGDSRFNGDINLYADLNMSNYDIECYRLTVNGNFYNYSDDRLKVKASNIPEALSKISQINGFYYTDSDAVTDLKNGKDNDENQLYREKTTTQKVGVSAQEIQAVLPEVVGKSNSSKSATDTEYLSVDYTKIVPLLIEGIKELKTKVETLETKVAALEGG